MLGLSTCMLAACEEPTGPDLPTTRVSTSFLFERDSLAFENFGGIEYGSVLTPTLMARMFGKDTVCIPADGECRLIPIAKEYLQAVNQSIRGGRCEGFAVLSGLAAAGALDLTPFGAAHAHDLVLEGNTALGSELAYWFSTQYLRDVVPESTLPLDALGALEFLHGEIKKSDHAMYRIGLARFDEETGELSGGHAILATYVAPGSAANQYVIGVYDNNHPDEDRQIVIDGSADSWSYQASANPDDPTTVYAGDTNSANLLYVAPVQPRQGQHPCTFCSLDAEDEESLAQVFGSASAEVVAVHASGARVGEQDGQFFDEHDNGHVLPSFTAACHDCRDGAHLVIPHHAGEGTLLEIREATHALIEEGVKVPIDVRFFGHGFAVIVEGADVEEENGEVHLLDIEGGGDDITFTSAPPEAEDVAVVSLAVELADLEQILVEARLEGSEVARLLVDPLVGNPTVRVRGATASGTTRMRMTRHSQDDIRTFTADVPTPQGSSATVVLDESQTGGDVIVLLDRDDDGQPDERLVLPDLQDATEELDGP